MLTSADGQPALRLAAAIVLASFYKTLEIVGSFIERANRTVIPQHVHGHTAILRHKRERIYTQLSSTKTALEVVFCFQNLPPTSI